MNIHVYYKIVNENLKKIKEEIKEILLEFPSIRLFWEWNS